MNRIRTATAALAAAAALAPLGAGAIPFDGSTGTTATVVVNATAGVGVDYTSLAAAATAYNGVATINRPWVLLIDSDLSEPTNIAFGTNVASGNSLTIRPNVAKVVTVTLTSVTALPGTAFFGQLLFGCNANALAGAPSATNTFETNNAYVLDGSNTPGGTTRDLTIQNVAGDVVGNLIRVVGTCNGIVIRNVNLLGLRTGSAQTGIGFAGGKITGFGTQGDDFKSDNAIVENCFIQTNRCSSATGGIAINYSNAASGTLTAPKNFDSHVIRNNRLVAKHRGISGLYSTNAQYLNNTISVANFTTGGGSSGITHPLQNGTPTTTYTVVIANNRIIDLQTSNTTAASGIAGLLIGGGTNCVYDIRNNVITGFLVPGAPSSQFVQGIQCASATSTYYIEHNSINMGTTPGALGTTGGVVSAILLPATNPLSYIRNNNIRTDQTSGSALYFSGTNNIAPSSISGNNIFKTAAVPVFLTVNAPPANYLTATDATTAGYGTGGAQSVDPAATTPAWATDLSFASAPAGLGVVATSAVATDINGQTRPATGAYPGAYRVVPPATVGEWSLYN